MLIVAYYERWSGRHAARQHWNAAVHFTPGIAADTLPPQSPYPYLFKPYSRPPQFGSAPSQQDENLNVFPVAWASVRQWQRWRPQPVLGQFIAGDQPIIEPYTPTPVYLWPYLFRRYRLEPWLGWADRADSPPPVIPAPEPTRSLPLYPYLFKRYRLQPWLGRSWAWDSSVTPAPPPTRARPNAGLVYLLLHHNQRAHRGWTWRA